MFLLYIFLLFNWSSAAEFTPVIQTTKGPMKGLVLTTIRESKKYHSYRGIPYGKPPIGHLRFRIPKDGKDTNLKAVMFWIFGGAFVVGAPSKFYYSPDYLIEEDIVVVTVNYRLGALGFLALQHQNATGNAGLKDQNLGLRWVRDNIAKFGGDPNKVTIVGESSGSVSVDLHLLSEKSKGLYRSSIAMSGVSLCYWGFSIPKDATERA
ncbi:esterase B1-like isoform X2 [Vespa velutina]|uniref:esterase B1-like isoform X2 n=1 Tax=Vespa velutina TaxID=202808 RepID=UPI001FB37FEF|nr:esterase B1-like isoform X2 [Vespa velutina]